MKSHGARRYRQPVGDLDDSAADSEDGNRRCRYPRAINRRIINRRIINRRTASTSCLVAGLAGFAVSLAAAVAQGGATVGTSGAVGSGGIDAATSRWIMARRGGVADWLMSAVTELGSMWLLWPVIIVVGLASHRRSGSWSALRFLVTTAAATVVVVNLIKAVVGRGRPPLEFMMVTVDSASFPSAHSAQAVAVWTAVAVVWWYGSNPGRGARAAMVGAAGVVGVSVMASRVYLGAHWLTDVVGGASLGLVLMALCWLFLAPESGDLAPQRG